MQRNFQVSIDFKSFAYAVFLAGLLWLAWEIKGILGMLFVAFILSTGLRPVVDYLAKRRVPKSLSVTIIYLCVAVFLLGVFLSIANEFVRQLINLVNTLPNVFSRVVEFISTNLPAAAQILPLNALQQELGVFVNSFINSGFTRNLVTGENVLKLISQTFGVFGSVAGVLITVATIFIVSAFMLNRDDHVMDGIFNLLPDDWADSLRALLSKVETKIGSWLIGELALMTIIGVITYFIIIIPGFFDPNYVLDDFAIPLALLAGLLEALPTIGPLITLVLSTILAAGTSGLPAFIYIGVSFTILQNIEAWFIVPAVMKRAVDVDPVLSILGVLAAFQLAGVPGALLAIPFMGMLKIIVEEIALEYKKYHRKRPKLVK